MGIAGAAAALAMALAAQAAPPVVTAPEIRVAEPPGIQPGAPSHVRLSAAPLYIYSFLDVRERELNWKVITEIDRQLADALAASGVKSKVLHFKDATLGTNFSYGTAQPSPGEEVSFRIPVDETIKSNLADERELGARYRLIAFPARVDVSGPWREYQIRWTLSDCSTGNIIWTYVYEGRTMIWYSDSERAQSRAKSFVDAVIFGLSSGGYLGP